MCYPGLPVTSHPNSQPTGSTIVPRSCWILMLVYIFGCSVLEILWVSGPTPGFQSRARNTTQLVSLSDRNEYLYQYNGRKQQGSNPQTQTVCTIHPVRKSFIPKNRLLREFLVKTKSPSLNEDFTTFGLV